MLTLFNSRSVASKDGGYYAIKGFTYQFDKSLLEILSDTGSGVEIENIQDIGTDRYYIQVKYKETQKYTDSKIRPAIIQLLECSIKSKAKNTKLYCYFFDKSPAVVTLSIDELNRMLGKQSGEFNERAKMNFVKTFVLEFSEDFEAQFAKVIGEIKRVFRLKTDEEAVTHHAIFKSHLLDIALRKKASDRRVSCADLQSILDSKEKLIFEAAYSKYLTLTRYLDYVRKDHFSQRKLNTASSERLFIVEIDEKVKDADLVQIISNIVSRYHKKDISPAPYVYLYGLEDARLDILKQKLWDKDIFFADGTHFKGDKFRLDDLIKETHKDNRSDVTCKLVGRDSLISLLKKKVIDETFIFITKENRELKESVRDSREFYIEETRNVSKIILP